MRYCGIKKTVVLGKDDLSAGQRIILVVETAEAASHNLASIREALRPHIAVYMLPDAICTLDRIPLNANGKFDVNQIARLADL